MKMYKRLAKPCSYAKGKRKRRNVKYIVIHYTGNTGDTARGNVDYFATTNSRMAGAHFFVGSKGAIGRSIPMNRTAYAVGGDHRSGKAGEASYYRICTNANSVSIELCNLTSGYPSKAQVAAVKKLVKYIRRWCPNAKTIIRHWDVNGKICPATMVGPDNRDWRLFKNEIK